MITIRRLQSGEADLFRTIRLQALQESPHAFASTYESALQRTSESWIEQAESTTQGKDRATFLVFSNQEPIGIAALYRLEGKSDTGELLQVWISPDHRGSNAARALLDAIFAWAGENDFHSIQAVVAASNLRALTFYAKYGFLNEMPEITGQVTLVKEVKKS